MAAAKIFARRALSLLGSVALGLVASGCSSRLPMPPATTHPTSAYAEVPYPPPAALVEVVPAAPDDDDAVWFDGSWIWRGRYYVWQRGGWLIPPENARYAPWQSLLARDGRIVFAPAKWYGPDRRPLPPPKVLSVARTPPNQTTVETEAAR
jgi:hypothetical protein